MANKRQLKKRIAFVCGDMAAECIVAQHIVKGADIKMLNEAICDIARLQEQSLQRVNIAYEHRPKDFENLQAYHRARSKYFAEAYAALDAQFNKTVQEIVDKMNKALPKAK